MRTGVVRKIDGLGRVVIPKEIRSTLGIQEGDPIEIFAQSGTCVLKRYNPISAVNQELNIMYATLKASGIKCAVYDYAGVKIKGNMNFPARIERWEFEENPEKFFTISANDEVQGYVMPDPTTTPEQKLMLKTSVTLIEKILEGEDS